MPGMNATGEYSQYSVFMNMDFKDFTLVFEYRKKRLLCIQVNYKHSLNSKIK